MIFTVLLITIICVLSISFSLIPFGIIELDSCKLYNNEKQNITIESKYYFIPWRGVCPSYSKISIEELEINNDTLYNSTLYNTSISSNITGIQSFAKSIGSSGSRSSTYSGSSSKSSSRSTTGSSSSSSSSGGSTSTYLIIFSSRNQNSYSKENKNNINYNECKVYTSDKWNLSNNQKEKIYIFLAFTYYCLIVYPISFIIIEYISEKWKKSYNIYKYGLYFIFIGTGCILWSIGIETTNKFVYFTKDYWTGDIVYGSTCNINFYTSDGYVVSIIVIVFTTILTFFIGIQFIFNYLTYDDILAKERFESLPPPILQDTIPKPIIITVEERGPNTNYYEMNHIKKRISEEV